MRALEAMWDQRAVSTSREMSRRHRAGTKLLDLTLPAPRELHIGYCHGGTPVLIFAATVKRVPGSAP